MDHRGEGCVRLHHSHTNVFHPSSHFTFLPLLSFLRIYPSLLFISSQLSPFPPLLTPPPLPPQPIPSPFSPSSSPPTNPSPHSLFSIPILFFPYPPSPSQDVKGSGQTAALEEPDNAGGCWPRELSESHPSAHTDHASRRVSDHHRAPHPCFSITAVELPHQHSLPVLYVGSLRSTKQT